MFNSRKHKFYFVKGRKMYSIIIIINDIIIYLLIVVLVVFPEFNTIVLCKSMHFSIEGYTNSLK